MGQVRDLSGLQIGGTLGLLAFHQVWGNALGLLWAKVKFISALQFQWLLSLSRANEIFAARVFVGEHGNLFARALQGFWLWRDHWLSRCRCHGNWGLNGSHRFDASGILLVRAETLLCVPPQVIWAIAYIEGALVTMIHFTARSWLGKELILALACTWVCFLGGAGSQEDSDENNTGLFWK